MARLRPTAIDIGETSIREILFASDLTPESERAFEHARSLAERFRAALTLYHVVEFPPEAYLRVIRGEAEEVLVGAEREARRRLERWAAPLTVPHQVVVEREAASDQADVALIELIRRTRPDLTVMATHGRKGFARFFVGSVTQQVVQHAGRPVLCVRKPLQGAGVPYERVLVPTDLSPASRRAFPLAALVARGFEAEVVALHVCPPSTAARLVSVPGATPAGVPGEEDVRRFLQPEFEGLPLAVQVYVNGAPWYRIVQVAEEEKIVVRQMTRDLERFDQKKAADIAYYTYVGSAHLAVASGGARRQPLIRRARGEEETRDGRKPPRDEAAA